MRVIDSSSLVKYFSQEENWRLVEHYMLEGVITLDLAIKEISNALWKKILYKEISLETVKTILHDLVEKKPLMTENQEKYLIKAFEIAAKHKITIYDALFIALAEDRGLELITSDKQQKEIAEKLGIKTIYIP